jgi:hypothetical protein
MKATVQNDDASALENMYDEGSSGELARASSGA